MITRQRNEGDRHGTQAADHGARPNDRGGADRRRLPGGPGRDAVVAAFRPRRLRRRQVGRPVRPLLRGFFDRGVLLAELAKKPATNQAVLNRSAFLAEAGDAAGADATLGPIERDDKHLAHYRTWLHEYAAAHAA
jgi:hypothetical protein